MSGVSHDEEAEIHVGVVVRPLRGHWRPVKLSGQPWLDSTNSKGSPALDPSVWKTARNANNEANIQFTSKMVYSGHNIKEIDSSFDKRNRSTHPEEAVRYRRGETQGSKFESPPLKRIDQAPDLVYTEKAEGDANRLETKQEMAGNSRNEVSSRKRKNVENFPKHEEKSESSLKSSESSVSKSNSSTKSLPLSTRARGQDSKDETQITSKPLSEIANQKCETIASGPLLSNYLNRPNNLPKDNTFQPRNGGVKMKLYQDASKAPLKSEPFSTSDLSSPLTDERGEKSVVHDQIARLTRNQRAMVRSSHSCMERESTRNGLGLFVRLFSEYPQYKSIWPQFREIPDSALISSDQLRNHGIVYMAGLKQVVAVLDDDDKLIEVAKRIAGSHCKWNICKFHIENMVPSLLEVLNLCMGGEMTPEIANSWTTLYDIIGNIINIEKTKCNKNSHS